MLLLGVVLHPPRHIGRGIAPGVVSDHLVTAGEEADLLVPAFVAACILVAEDHGVAFTMGLVVQLDVVDPYLGHESSVGNGGWLAGDMVAVPPWRVNKARLGAVPPRCPIIYN